jgi:C-terminal processing protease CtpA/Prc
MRNAILLTLGLSLATPCARAFAQDESSKTQDVDKLVTDLGADDLKKRDEAQKKLEALGKKALPALEKAEKESQDAEVRARAHEAILSIKKGSGDDQPKDQEREGPPMPPERRLQPRMPRMPDSSDKEFEQFFKMFEGQDNPAFKEMPKIFEMLRKQMEGMDREFDKELQRPRDNGRGNGGVRVFQFQTRSKTTTETKLGFIGNPPSAALQAQLDLTPTSGGLLMDEITPNGAAWKAGLKQYDVVLSIDGKAVRGPDDLKGLGEKDAKVEILRKAKKETLVVHPTSDEPKAPEPKKDDDKKPEPPTRKF